jgi:hypothetical protein
MRSARRRLSVFVAATCSVLAIASTAPAQLLLRDDFNGAGNVDTTVWRLPFNTEGTFVGRTQFRGNSATDMPQQGVVEPTAEDGKVMEINLDTYSPIDPGNQFLGTDLLTKRDFARAGGLTFEARMRLKPTTTGGLVAGGFLYDVTRNISNPSPPPATIPVRDEIDYELLSNQATGAATNDPFTNYWNDKPTSDPGSGQFVDVAGVNLTQFQNYKVEWTPQSIKWYVNNQLVRTQTSGVPDDPMKLHFNLWAPDSSFANAFNAALNPAATPGANQNFKVQVDHVEVNRSNTTPSANLLTDPSFESLLTEPNPGPTFIGSVPANTTGKWLGFGGPPNALHVSYQFDDPGGQDPGVPNLAHDGLAMAKVFGPFNGFTDASGLVQNVPASAGDTFELTAWMQAPSGDTIIGKQNYNNIQISFLDAAGNVLPGNVKDAPVLDGRDPNIPADQWVKGVVDAVAPAGTAYARASLFFIQLANEGGAAWWDDVSLIKLTANVTPVNGDYNSDGHVDVADYVEWRKFVGTSTVLPNDPTGGTIGQSQYITWRENFGMSSGAASASGLDGAGGVPEPGSFVMASIALAMAGICRRRSAA